MVSVGHVICGDNGVVFPQEGADFFQISLPDGPGMPEGYGGTGGCGAAGACGAAG